MRLALKLLAGTAALYVFILIVLGTLGAADIKRHRVEAGGFALSIVAAAILAVSARAPGYRESAADEKPYPAIVIAILSGVMLWPALHVGLLSDDFVLQSWAQSARWLGDGSSFARPMVLTIWRAVEELGGGPTTLHAISLVLHGLNIVLTMLLAQRLGLSPPGATAAALVVAFWPTQVEPVAWTAGMFDVLMSTFVLGAMLAALTETPTGIRLVAIATLTTAALLTKETAIAIPLLWTILIAPRFATLDTARPKVVLAGAVIGVTCAVYLMWRYVAGLPLAGISTVTRYVLKEQLSRTIGGLTLPFTVDTLSAWPWIRVVAASTTLAASAVLLLRRAQGLQVIGVQGLLWALAAAAPTIGYLFIGTELDGSRYLYLPSVGWAIFLGAALERSRQSAWAFILSPLLAMMLALAMYQRQLLVRDWTEAATARERILASAVETSEVLGCATVVVTGLPPRHKSAQLFNNGFAESFKARHASDKGSRTCQLLWTGEKMAVR